MCVFRTLFHSKLEESIWSTSQCSSVRSSPWFAPSCQIRSNRGWAAFPLTHTLTTLHLDLVSHIHTQSGNVFQHTSSPRCRSTCTELISTTPSATSSRRLFYRQNTEGRGLVSKKRVGTGPISCFNRRRSCSRSPPTQRATLPLLLMTPCSQRRWRRNNPQTGDVWGYGLSRIRHTHGCFLHWIKTT